MRLRGVKDERMCVVRWSKESAEMKDENQRTIIDFLLCVRTAAGPPTYKTTKGGWVRLWECKMSTHRARLLELLCSSSSLISKWVESLPIFFCLFFLPFSFCSLFHTAAFLAHPDASVSDAAHCCLFYSYFGVVCFFHPHLASLCENCVARCQGVEVMREKDML